VLISRFWKPAKIATLAVAVALPLVLSGTAPTNAQNRDPVVLLETSKGPIAIRVFQSLVPNTSRAWLGMVDEGFYNGLSFHRVESWVVQGGCPIGNGTGNYINPATGRARYLPLEINRSLGARSGRNGRDGAHQQSEFGKLPVLHFAEAHAAVEWAVHGFRQSYSGAAKRHGSSRRRPHRFGFYRPGRRRWWQRRRRLGQRWRWRWRLSIRFGSSIHFGAATPSWSASRRSRLLEQQRRRLPAVSSKSLRIFENRSPQLPFDNTKRATGVTYFEEKISPGKLRH
jgi:hypothetical protein